MRRAELRPFSMGINVARRPRSADRVYPRDLHAILKGWDNTPFFPKWPGVDLPPKAILEKVAHGG